MRRLMGNRDLDDGEAGFWDDLDGSMIASGRVTRATATSRRVQDLVHTELLRAGRRRRRRRRRFLDAGAACRRRYCGR